MAAILTTETPPLGYAKITQRLTAFLYDLFLYAAAFIVVGAIAMIFIVNDLPGDLILNNISVAYIARDMTDAFTLVVNDISSIYIVNEIPSFKLRTLGWFTRTNPIYIFMTWIILPIAFFGWFWTRGGQTLSMRSWRIRVERLDGSNISWLQSMIRLSPLLISLAISYYLKINAAITVFSVGAICMLWSLVNKKGQGLNDVIAGSRVIRVERGYVPPKHL